MKYLALGERIRRLRKKKGLSVEDLAESVGIAAEKLESIESNDEQPIIATLIQLSKALGVNVADIFRDRPTKAPYEIVRAKDREKIRPLLKPSKARLLDYRYELLSTPSPDKHMDAYLIELPPHQTQRPSNDLTHPGEEFMFILEGEIHCEIAHDKFVLKTGDSIYFRSTEPHVFHNPKDQSARAIAVIYPY